MGSSLQRRSWLDRIGLIVLAGSSGSYRLDHISSIVLAGSYWLDHIGIGLGFARKNWILCAGWFDTGWMGHMEWMGRWWDGGGMEVTTLAGSGTGAPPLDLEVWRTVGSGGWYQLRWCCKGAEYLCRSSKIIQIDCTKIRTNM